MKGHLLMSRNELKRKSLFEWVKAGHGTLVQAAEQLNLSYRQVKRAYGRWRKEGDKGLVHRSRGRGSNRRYPEKSKRAILKRCTGRYIPLGFGPTLMAEKLAEDGYQVDHETLRRWLLETGQWSKRRKRAKHRLRRERRPRFGELLQMDGSHHQWFGSERPEACLMNIVDDATSVTMSLLDEEETTEAAMRLLWKWIKVHGIPRALYTDRKTVFITDREPTLEEQLAGEEPLTVFGKACAKLGIRIIPANSPQAKGRVERNHGVYQDRLVKELRLKRITTIEAANKLLDNGFIEHLNTRFAVLPVDPINAHRTLTKDIKLEDIFAFEDRRVLTNDWTVRHENRYYQILEENRPLPKPKDKLLIRRRLDNTLLIEYKDKHLTYRELTPREIKRKTMKETKPSVAEPIPLARPAKTNSPWRHGSILMRADKKTKSR
jgi:transposase